MNKQLINRTLASSFSDVFSVLPVITLTGPRQSGKTTLCREMFPELPYVSLEDADTLAEVQADPKAFFNRFPQTWTADFFANLNYLRPLLKERLLKTTVVYDGYQENPNADNGIVNSRHLQW